MTRTEMYFAAPVWAQNALITAYGYYLKRLRYGKAQRRMLGEILATEFAAPGDLLDFQVQKLREIVNHALTTVPLYRDRGLPNQISDPADLSVVPTLSKHDLQRPRAVVTSSLYKGRLEEIHTGGTTGTPLTIYCSREALRRNYAFFARFRASAGVPIGVRTAVFAGRTIVRPAQNKPPYWRWNGAANTMLFSSYHIGHATAEAYARRLSRLQPKLIDSYPSALEPIARYLSSNPNISVRPNAIITSSETLAPEVRRLFEEVFQCRVFDHYGAAEMAALITQCREGSYHVNQEFGYLEIVKDGRGARPGEVGEIVATGFVNPVMPLIRYATGDLAAWREGACSCGRQSPMVEQLVGRMDDVVTTPDGRIVGRLDPIFKAVSAIYEARIVQDRSDHVRVELVSSELPQVEIDKLRAELRNRLGPLMDIDIELVPEIARTTRGKLRTVVNLTLRSSFGTIGA